MAWDIGGGRTIDRLVFVTNRSVLASRVGQAEVDDLVATLEGAGHLVVDLGSGQLDPGSVGATVRGVTSQHSDVAGVVVIGGHEVCPSERVDALPQELQGVVARSDDDPDGFVVWCDDLYGDVDGDGLPELPVSRVIDAGDLGFLKTQLSARPRSNGTPRSGVRNVARPFADHIYDSLPGSDPLLISAPTTSTSPPHVLGSDRVYLMLHGAYWDTTKYFGEDGKAYPVAVDPSNLPPADAGVVFVGCCWGALTATDIAAKGGTPATRGVTTSLALDFLSRGALAFVGCTGSHYSPQAPPYGYSGGPIHEAFWSAVVGGTPPARALFDARTSFAGGIPHQFNQPNQVAIESKLFRQFACLGLGW